MSKSFLLKGLQMTLLATLCISMQLAKPTAAFAVNQFAGSYQGPINDQSEPPQEIGSYDIVVSSEGAVSGTVTVSSSSGSGDATIDDTVSTLNGTTGALHLVGSGTASTSFGSFPFDITANATATSTTPTTLTLDGHYDAVIHSAFGDVNQSKDFTIVLQRGAAATHSISGRLFNLTRDPNDANALVKTGLDGIVVKLFANNVLLKKRTTSNGGFYSFGNLADGIYSVVVKSSSALAPAAVTPVAGGDVTKVNFPLYRVVLLAKRASDGLLLSGVPINVHAGPSGSGLDIATTTNGVGRVILYIAAGGFSAQPVQAGFSFNPPSGGAVLPTATSDPRYPGVRIDFSRTKNPAPPAPISGSANSS